jgi:MarR family transcriptional regulator, 2-MHQ and catechol-resistance regulon repressor
LQNRGVDFLNTSEDRINISDTLLFFPIQLTSVINFIISFLDEEYPRDISVILVLKKYGPMPISHIGEKLCVRKSNMTGIIDDLVQRGCVKRCTSPEDRRVINIEMTQEGERELNRILLKVDKILEEKIKVLTEEEYEKSKEAASYLTKMIEKLMMLG